MLEFGSKTITVDGITVFADHADPNQFWYLPGPVQLARRPVDNRAAFTFIKYGEVQGNAIQAQGFLMFEVNLRLDPYTERKIVSKLSSIAPGRPKLAAVPFDEGTVECIALDLQGGGGTVAQVSEQGTFRAVESILGTSTPSLHGDNSAAFSLSLSKQGAVILEDVFKGAGSPIGTVYSLKFTGLRPALDVEITANFRRVYDHFSANLEGQVYFIRAGIEAGFEKLVQDGVIEIKVINYSTAEDRMEQEKWALDFFKEKLLDDWFKPTLTPGQLQGGMAEAASLESVRNNMRRQQRPNPTPAPPTPNPSGDETPPIVDPGRTADQNSGAPEPAFAVQNPVAAAAGGIANTGAMPPQSGAPVARQSSGVQVPQNNVPNDQNIPAGTPLVSFKLKYIKQIEDKTITLKFNRSEAVQRTYAPQGFFGLFAEDLSREGHFFEVDGDDPFFREFRVSVETPFDKERIGLSSCHVKLIYGEEGDPNPKLKDFVIDKNSEEKLDWLVKMTPGLTNYDYTVQYHFDPDSDWQGEKYSYDLARKTTEDRTLLLVPFDRLGFLEVEVSPSLVDWSAVANVEVHLAYLSSTGWESKKTLYFTENLSNPQSWKLRLSDPESRTYQYHCVYRLKNGEKKTTEPVMAEATKVAVPNPFHTIDVEFLPLFNPGAVRMIFVDLLYEDIENGHEFKDRFQMDTSSFDSVMKRIQIVDPAKQTFSYRLTIVGNTGKLVRGAFIETQETLIGVNDSNPQNI